MIRKTLALLALVVLPLFAAAQTDSASVLTPSGRLYTVESVYAAGIADLKTTATHVLTMTVNDGDGEHQAYVPGSLLDGTHTSPAIAYDADSDTLFVFWERGRNGRLTSELVFCSYHAGAWSEPIAIESANFERSTNLRIGVTKKIESTNDRGNVESLPELTVHAVWWNESGASESARYAMLTITDGLVASISVHKLTDFLPDENIEKITDAQAVPPPPINAQLLRQPVIIETPGRASVDVIFGEVDADTLQKVSIKPVLRVGANGRLRVPVGRSERVGAPAFRTEATGRIGGLESGNHLGLYMKTSDSLLYSTYQDGEWTAARSLSIGHRLTYDAAIDAVRRRVEE